MLRTSGASFDWTLVRTTSLMFSHDWTSSLIFTSVFSASKSEMIPSHRACVPSLYDGTSRSMVVAPPASSPSPLEPQPDMVSASAATAIPNRSAALVFLTMFLPLLGA